MKLRDFLRLAVFVAASLLHFYFEMYAWQIHLGVASATEGDRLWATLSFPLFTLFSRRAHTLYFYELLISNSLIWGAVVVWVMSMVFRPRSTGTKLSELAAARTQLIGAIHPTTHPAQSTPLTPTSSETDHRARRRMAPAGARTFGHGRYEILQEIGRGGFSTVYRARDHTRGIDVAVKAIDVSSIDPDELPNFIEAFHHEAAIAGRLDHPGIVPVFDHDSDARPPFIVMSLIRGGTLRERIGGNECLPWPEVVKLGVQVAEALDYARQHGVRAHRDIKPGNIFCADTGYKVGDFGIARRVKVGESEARTLLAGAGTPGYMAPEQSLAPNTVDWRADLFALAAVLYEALSGKRPFRGVRIEYDPDEDTSAMRAVLEAAYSQSVPFVSSYLISLPGWLPQFRKGWSSIGSDARRAGASSSPPCDERDLGERFGRAVFVESILLR